MVGIDNILEIIRDIKLGLIVNETIFLNLFFFIYFKIKIKYFKSFKNDKLFL